VVPELDPVTAFEVSNRLVTQGDRAAEVAGALVLGASVPDDHYEIGEMLVAFERDRATFDQRFAGGLRSAGAKIAEVALEVVSRDETPPLLPYPLAAGRPGGS
jgi:hypothetical protein